MMTAAEAEELWWASANGGGAVRLVQAYHDAGGKIFFGWCVRSGMTMLIDREGYELCWLSQMSRASLTETW